MTSGLYALTYPLQEWYAIWSTDLVEHGTDMHMLFRENHGQSVPAWHSQLQGL